MIESPLWCQVLEFVTYPWGTLRLLRPRTGTASHLQARCERDAGALLACCYGVANVFASYSLGVLLVF